jgi:hypothetical protein
MSKASKIVVIVIGSLGVAAGLYSVFTGGEFDEYWLPFFGGFTLIGVALSASKGNKEA